MYYNHKLTDLRLGSSWGRNFKLQWLSRVRDPGGGSGAKPSEAGEVFVFIGSRALSFSGPLLSVSVEFCLLVCPQL